MDTHGVSSAPVRAGAASRFVRALASLTAHPVTVEFWEGSTFGSSSQNALRFRILDRRALGRFLAARPDVAFGRAYVEGLFEVEPLGEFLECVNAIQDSVPVGRAASLVAACIALGAKPVRERVGDVEATIHGKRHSLARDAQAIRHHYDLPVDFYSLFLDPTLTYSCAYFTTPDDTIDEAQREKLDLVCRKLRLRPGERVLDIGCGWGSFALHAAQEYGASVLGITLSPSQHRIAKKRIRERHLETLADVKLLDYRADLYETFDAVASIGMVEHVGARQMSAYALAIARALKPEGRALIHGITVPPVHGTMRGSFIDTFVFPDGELVPVTWRDEKIAATGLELRDVENLREHYALTLDRWVARLEDHWEEACAIVGEKRARVWKLYMTGSKVAFTRGSVSIHQSLFVKLGDAGESRLPLRRSDWYAPRQSLTGAAHGRGVQRARVPS